MNTDSGVQSTSKSDVCRLARRLIRAYCNANTYLPVRIVPGKKPPTIVGHSFYFTTPSGKTIVHYPRAYGYRVMYHPSTRRVEVGREWVLQATSAMLEFAAVQQSSTTKTRMLLMQ